MRVQAPFPKPRTSRRKKPIASAKRAARPLASRALPVPQLPSLRTSSSLKPRQSKAASRAPFAPWATSTSLRAVTALLHHAGRMAQSVTFYAAQARHVQQGASRPAPNRNAGCAWGVTAQSAASRPVRSQRPCRPAGLARRHNSGPRLVLAPNPSIEGTCPGKPGHAPHVKR